MRLPPNLLGQVPASLQFLLEAWVLGLVLRSPECTGAEHLLSTYWVYWSFILPSNMSHHLNPLLLLVERQVCCF